MRFGLFFAFQIIPGQPTSLQEPYRDMLECLPRAEELGYASVFTASHHVQPDGWCPSPLLPLAAATAVTERMRIGTGVLLVPLYAPLKLAEDVAVLDSLSGGRFVLGVGPGYVSEEFLAHGVPREERISRMEEALDLMQLAWTEERFSFRGRFYTVVPEAALSPRPVQKPHPPIWYGVSGPKSLRRAAKRQAVLVSSPRHELSELKEHFRIYEEAAAETGFVSGERPVIREVFIADKHEKAEELAAPGIEYLFRELYGAKSAEGERELRTDAGELVTDKHQVDFESLRNRFVIGDPDYAIRQIERYRDELGATEILCWMHVPGVSGKDAMRSVELFAREVMPAFARETASAT
jgi:alkanesulfonate monooxygenase SsuD/methylene tetrahydromethanopterin reductase-like flavin-dependent oxidoreductase (luciferase family)